MFFGPGCSFNGSMVNFCCYFIALGIGRLSYSTCLDLFVMDLGSNFCCLERWSCL